VEPSRRPIGPDRRRSGFRFALGSLAFVLTGLLGLVGCDSGIEGEADANRAPDTALAVRDSSLVGDIDDDDRLTSTVLVSWSGTDADGFVTAFDLRFYPGNTPVPGPDEEWTRTTRSDSLVLLPIPPDSDVANVVFEVRAVDNEGAVDPDPARTVFPIRNSPPTFRLSSTLVPADTTWPVTSFGWQANDPDGIESLAGVEVSLNDSLNFVPLPPEVDFVTLVAADPSADGPTDAEVFFGTNFIPSGITLPGLQLDAENVLYARAVDGTGTTSGLDRFPLEGESWYVRAQTSDVLLVNDFRRAENDLVLPFHRDVLAGFAGTFDEWDLSAPFITGNNPVIATSDALPVASSPTLRRTLALWDRIYWVSNATTDQVAGYNLPVAAGVSDLFFDGGGRMFVQVPVRLPTNPENDEQNPAINILPIGGLITIPDTLVYNNLRISSNTEVRAVEPVPGTGELLPALRTAQLITQTLPYLPGDSVPLYETDYQATVIGGGRVDWTGPNTVASISEDRRVALLALPVVNDFNGNLFYEGADGDAGAPADAIRLILRALDFPQP
jgi:hypothetical protein